MAAPGRAAPVGDWCMTSPRKPRSMVPPLVRRWRCEAGHHRLHPIAPDGAVVLVPGIAHRGGWRCWDCGTASFDGFPGSHA